MQEFAYDYPNEMISEKMTAVLHRMYKTLQTFQGFD